MSLSKSLVYLVFGALFLGWVSVAEATTPPPILPAQEKLAKRLLNTRCAKCHKAPEISKYSEGAWQFNLAQMAPKAKLTPQETEALTRYINLTLFMNSPHPYP